MTRDTTTEATTDILPVRVRSSGEAVDLDDADITFVLTTREGRGETVLEVADDDDGFYGDAGDIDAELESILDINEGLTPAEAVDLSEGRFVVEIEPGEMPLSGTYWQEVRATWPSGRSFADVIDSVTVGKAATEPPEG